MMAAVVVVVACAIICLIGAVLVLRSRRHRSFDKPRDSTYRSCETSKLTELSTELTALHEESKEPNAAAQFEYLKSCFRRCDTTVKQMLDARDEDRAKRLKSDPVYRSFKNHLTENEDRVALVDGVSETGTVRITIQVRETARFVLRVGSDRHRCPWTLNPRGAHSEPIFMSPLHDD